MVATVFVVGVPKNVSAEEPMLPTVPGFNVETYAILPGPVSLCFDSTGVLYVGHDSRYTGGGAVAPARIRRIGVGGTPIEEFGDLITDPDTAVVDVTGIVSGTVGSILVGGFTQGTTMGLISMISPDGESTSALFGPTTDFMNPTDMIIDSTGRLIFADPDNIQGDFNRIYQSTGNFPTVLFSIGAGRYPFAVALDSADRIYVSGYRGNIFIHDSNGVQVVDPFGSSSTSIVALAIGPGDATWGDDLYVLTRETSELLRFDIQQNPFQIQTTPTVIGTGFVKQPTVGLFDLAFGPDNALYVTEHKVFDDNYGRILRISPENDPPIANAGGPYVGYEGTAIPFDASDSNDPNGDLLEYRWDYDSDGEWDTGWSGSPYAEFTWNDEYSGTVTVEVSDGTLTATATASVTVHNADPVIQEIASPLDPISIGTPTDISAPFTDQGILDYHHAQINWGDGAITDGVVDETGGSGTVTGSHPYTTPGVYLITLTVWDFDGGEASITTEYVVQYDPYGAFVTGGGMIYSPAGAYTPDSSLTGKASFGFVSKYQNGATTPDGNTQFRFHTADFKFQSTSYDWMVVAGPKAMFKGSGTINGEGDYDFLLSAIDGEQNGGGGVDKFRIKISDKVSGDIIYDNQMGEDEYGDPTTVLTHGSIKIHKA
jgi:PKD repeat protein